VTAATDLFGTETAETALALGVPPERISTIAAVFPIGQIRDAVTMQAGRRVHGKIVVTLWPRPGEGVQARRTAPAIRPKGRTAPSSSTGDEVRRPSRRCAHGVISCYIAACSDPLP
jgi:hypothetical protein